MPQQQFKGYSEDQMKRIASKLGHTGNLNTFGSYLGSNPKALGKYNTLKNATTQRLARGGVVSGYDVGGDVVRNLYKTLLGREPEAGAAEAWSSTGKSLADITAEIGGSTEGKQRATAVAAGNTSFQRYVAPEFQDTTAGYDYNTTTESIDRLGRTGDNTAADAAAIQQIYQNQVGRAAETGGATAALAQMASGTNLDTIRANVAGSDEAQEFRDTGQQRYVAAEHQVAGTDYRTTDQTIDEFGRIVTLTEAEAEAERLRLEEAEKLRLAEEEKLRLEEELAEAIAANDAAAIEAAQLALDNAKAIQDMLDQTGGTGTGIDYTTDQTLGQTTLNQSLNPQLATGAKAVGATTTVNPDQLMDTTVGQVSNTTADIPTAVAGSATASTADVIVTPTVDPFSKVSAGATDAQDDVKTAQTNLTGETGTLSTGAKVEAQAQETSAVTALKAAQGTKVQVGDAPTRSIQAGEEVSAVANAQTAAAFTEQVNAAQADPTSRATVQGQLATLMTSFDEGKTPAWAAGAMRNVTATMAARGIGSSSMAGQALIQAALESALPIATADAQTYASFEVTNLNNKQQRAMLSAQQRATFMGQEFDQEFQTRVFNSTRIGEIANMNFTATQQIAIENAQLANTVNLTNLSNKQAKVMAEAAALSQLDMANLSNRQQEQVQNAQSFLEMDMANLTNKQQASMFKAQSRVTAILSDTAAENARKQFNATSENQMDQFYQELTSQVSQFNASQKTAVSQFNAGEDTAVSKFNADIKNQRDQFNAANSLVINQSNAQWRRTIATSDTATINRINEINAKSLLDISNTAYNNLWQEHRDEMDWTYQQSEGAFDRYANLVVAKLQAETTLTAAQIEADAATSSAAGTAIGSILTGNVTGTVIGGLLGIG